MNQDSRMKNHQWDSALDPEIAPLFLALQWAHGRSLEVMRPILSAHKLSGAEFDVLATLRNATVPHELTPSQLQEEVVITSGGLTKIMLQLEEKGLIQRLQSKQDMRIKPLRLTLAGTQKIEVAMQEMLDATRTWVSTALAPQETAKLLELLNKLGEKQD